MTRRFTRIHWLLVSVLLTVVSLHVASLCAFVRYYASSFVFEYGEGFVKIYWGGNDEFRNSSIYNSGEWPLLQNTHFAGGYLSDGQRWEVYGPGLQLDSRWFTERIRNWGFVHDFGYSLPQLRHQNDAASVVIPLGSLTLILELGALLFLFKGWRPDKIIGTNADGPRQLPMRTLWIALLAWFGR